MKEILGKIKKKLKKFSRLFCLRCFKWLECFNKKSNAAKVGLSGFLSAIIFVFIYFTVIKYSSEDSVGYWNFIILIVSSPVAFVIWQLRDENIRQQIENQRKDINLKEFQKLSEWVSGAHLPEIKIIDKKIEKNSTTDNESYASSNMEIIEETKEYSKEYGQKPDTNHFDTFGKRDGAVALQISAIYNLLPFFRGDYGKSFRLPAFNLLKSAWQAMQKDELDKLNELEKSSELYLIKHHELNEFVESNFKNNSKEYLKEFIKSLDKIDKKNGSRIKNLNEYYYNLEELTKKFQQENNKNNKENNKENNKDGQENPFFKNIEILEIINKLDKELIEIIDYIKKEIRKIIKNLKEKGNSPIGVALTHVLLSLNQEGTHLNLRDFPEMLENICLAGMNFNLIEIEKKEYSLNNLDFSIANFQGASLRKINFQKSNLSNAKFQYAFLYESKLGEAELPFIKLWDADLSHSDLRKAKGLSYKILSKAKSKSLIFAKITITDFYTRIHPDWKHPNSPEWGSLEEPEQKATMQKFCNETGMRIFDDDGNEVAKPES